MLAIVVNKYFLLSSKTHYNFPFGSVPTFYFHSKFVISEFWPLVFYIHHYLSSLDVVTVMEMSLGFDLLGLNRASSLIIN